MSVEQPENKAGIREIFLKALDTQSPWEREAYLQLACGTNAAVRANVSLYPVDARGLFFTPLGLGGPIPPDVAQRQAARECDRLRLPASVPPGVSKQFDKVLRLYADHRR